MSLAEAALGKYIKLGEGECWVLQSECPEGDIYRVYRVLLSDYHTLRLLRQESRALQHILDSLEGEEGWALLIEDICGCMGMRQLQGVIEQYGTSCVMVAVTTKIPARSVAEVLSDGGGGLMGGEFSQCGWERRGQVYFCRR